MWQNLSVALFLFSITSVLNVCVFVRVCGLLWCVCLTVQTCAMSSAYRRTIRALTQANSHTLAWWQHAERKPFLETYLYDRFLCVNNGWQRISPLDWHACLSSWMSVLMSWWCESDVLNKTDMWGVQSRGSPGTSLASLMTWHHFIIICILMYRYFFCLIISFSFSIFILFYIWYDLCHKLWGKSYLAFDNMSPIKLKHLESRELQRLQSVRMWKIVCSINIIWVIFIFFQENVVLWIHFLKC